MTIRGIIWGGTRTREYEAMTAFCRDVLAIAPSRDDGEAAFYDLPNGDRFEVLAADGGNADAPTGVSVGFLVEDVAASRAELEAKGVVFIGPVYRNEAGETWTNFRAPDGNLYSLTCFGEAARLRAVPGEAATG